MNLKFRLKKMRRTGGTLCLGLQLNCSSPFPLLSWLSGSQSVCFSIFCWLQFRNPLGDFYNTSIKRSLVTLNESSFLYIHNSHEILPRYHFRTTPTGGGGPGWSQKSFETFWRSGDYVFYPIGFKSHVTWFFFTAGGLLRAFHLNWNNSRVEIVKLNNKWDCILTYSVQMPWSCPFWEIGLTYITLNLSLT
jgi:hypothetical protein